ncbi:MAG TPA: hypothetical protein VGW12_16865 [Pyrinomonadaceae bacterium]|nr:hypothetical protein [Pyrinomonadaceae bacterium]
MHEDQKEVFDALFATVLAIVFLGLSALVLWPTGKAMISFRLAQGYWVFCIVMYPVISLTILLQRLFRVDMDSHFDAFVISNLVTTGFLLAGWSAYAVLAVQGFAVDASTWVTVLLYVIGFLSTFVAFHIVSTLYPGSAYRLVNPPLAFASFIIFSIWPAGARLLYGWFFNLFKCLTPGGGPRGGREHFVADILTSLAIDMN